MKKKYEKPLIMSEKMDMKLLHTTCTPGTWYRKNIYKPDSGYEVCVPVTCYPNINPMQTGWYP
jgi:hypothetical protein